MAKLTFTATTDTALVIETLLRDLTQEQIVQFVKDLDAEVAEWAFTMKLYDFFAAERRVYLDEHEIEELPDQAGKIDAPDRNTSGSNEPRG